MCKKLEKEGRFFIKINNLGVVEYSVGLKCFHSDKTANILGMVGNEFGKMIFPNNPGAVITDFIVEFLKDQTPNAREQVYNLIEKASKERGKYKEEYILPVVSEYFPPVEDS
jgi:hypothetical protein